MKLFTISLPSARAAVRQASIILLAVSSMLTYASAKTGNPKGNPGKGLSTCPTSISINIAPPAAYCTNTQGVLSVTSDGGSFTSPSYTWSASSGRITITPTNSATPDIDYITVGTVTISVTVTDASCGTYTASQTITVSSTPEPTITIPTTEVCEGNTITSITGSPSGNTRQWTVNEFSSGNPFGIFSAPTNQTTNFTTNHPGNAEIRYEVTTSAGCTGTSEAQPVTIYAPVVATASVASGNQPNVCAGSSLTLAASATGGNGTYTYEWEYMGGSQAVPAFVSAAILLDSLDVANPVLTPVGTASDGDTYIFRVKATDGITCNDFSDNITITVRQITSAALSLTGASTICEDGTTTFKVDVTRGNTGGSPTYTLVYNDGTADSTIANYVSGTELTTRALNADYTLQIVSIKDNRVTTSNCSSPSNSGTPGVTVNNLTAGSITGAVTICSGDDPDVFGSTAASGDGTITYLWESSTDGTSFTSTGIVTETFDPGVLTADTWYRRVATSTLNAVACSKTSNTIKVTVNNISATGSIGDAQTICPNTTPTSLSSTFAATGDGTISYQWHSSADGVTFSPISGANSASGYAPGALDNDTWYRLVATSTISADPVTCTTTSNDILIKVNNITSPGGIDSDQTVCAGETPAALTSTAPATGDGTISYQWQESTNNYTDYTDITGETSAGYSPPSASGDKWYLRIPISTEDAVSCPGESPLPVAITLNSITAGNIEGDTTICTGNDVSFTQSVAAVYDGDISYEWQSSTDGGNTWSPLASSNSATYTTAALTQTTKFRRKDISTLNSVECFAYTDTLTVTVITTNSGTWYVNDATGDDADLGTINCPKKTIQAAVNAAAAGDTVIVAAGTYAENVTIGKALDVRGPNWDVSPNGGSRVAEAIVVPAATNTSSGAVVTISTGNVSFRGFTLDGDNPGLASSGVGLGGVLGTSIDAARGIFLQANGITGVTISKNIAENAVNGIRLEQTTNYFATTSGALRSYNILVDDNKVQDMTGTGIRLGNSMYAKVTNNTVTNAENGIAFSSFRISDAGAASDRVIANNTITSRYSGIWVNLFHASPYALNNNTISVAPAATEMAPTPQSRTAWFGIMYSTVSAPQNFTNQVSLPKVTTPEYWTATGNAINGSALEESSTGYGYWLYYVDNNRDDMNVDHFGQISGGTVSGVDVGIMLKNKDTDPATNFGNAAIGAHAGVSGVAFSLRSGGTGFRLVDDATWITSNPAPLINKRTVQLTIGAGVTITGGATGLVLDHPVAGTANYTAYASITSGSLNNLALSGQSGNYIELVNHPNALNGTSATFGGNTGAAATLAQNFDIEDKISHKTDNATRGLVRVKASNVYVTTNSGSIQRGIDAASSADTVNVKAGTYEELVAFDKPLTLLGPNESIPGNGSRDAEAIVQFPSGAANGSVLLSAGTNISGVTISGFDLRCQDTTIPKYHYLVYTSKIDNLTIRNNRLYGSEIPLYILTANSQTDYRTGLLIEGNYIDGGPNVNNSYNRGMYIQATAGTIQDNVVLNTNIGIQYMPYGHTTSGTVQRNTISANLIGLYHNYQNKGAAQVTWSQNEVTVAANDRSGLKDSVYGAYTTQQLIFRGIETDTFGTEGSGAAPQVSFTNNKVDGTGAGSPNYTASMGFRNVTPAATGVATLSDNSLVNVDSTVVNKSAVGVVAGCNWHGSTSGNQIAAKISGPVTFSPWLVSGTDTASVTIGFQPASGTCTGTFPVVTLDTKQRISCFGGSNGAININIANGTAPFSYNWTGPNTYSNTTDQDITSLSGAGTYNLTLTDANGTTVVFADSITAPSAAVSASVSDTDITCNDADDGSITVSSPAGGYGTYETSVDGTNWFAVSIASPYTFSNLAPTSYNVRVRDAAETTCVTDLDGAGDTEITEPAVLAASVAKTNVTCNAANDGTITVSSPSGGYGTYQYRLNAGSWQSSGSFTGLAPGAYGVQIRDSLHSACVISLDSQTITEPAVLSATVAKTDVTCNAANDGTITVSSPTGGYGTYQYRLDAGTWQSSGAFTSLAPAIYSVQIRDSAFAACVIVLGNQTITQPNVLSATVQHTDITCNSADDGTITVSSPDGGYGTYEYRLDDETWQSSGAFTGLAPASYSVQIRDAAQTACVITLGDQLIEEPPVLSSSITSQTNVSCNGGNNGAATVTPAGGNGGNTYLWSNSQIGGTASTLIAGDYTVTVTDSKGCQTNTAVTITQPPVLTVNVPPATLSCNNGATTTLTATPAGGTSPYTYVWSGGGGTSATTSALGVGSYTVTVTDANSCTVGSAPASISNPTHPGDGVWYVNDNSLTGDVLTTAVGNNANIGTASCPFLTVSHAITQASAGHTINVDAGTYSENILVNKSLTLNGANAGVKATGSTRGSGESTIDGTGGGSSFVVTIEADNVTLDGLKVELRSSARDGINTRTGSPVSPATIAYRSNITLKNNWVYANLPSRTNQFNGIVFGEHTSNAAQTFSAEINNVTVEDNYIDLTSTSSNATPSNTSITGARGIVFTNMFRNSGASLTYNDLVVDDNTVFSTYNTIIQAQLQTRLVGATFTNNTIGKSRSGPNLPTLIDSSVFSNNTIVDINPNSDYYSNLTGAYLGVVNSTVEGNVFHKIGGTACLVIAGGRSADPTYFPASNNSTVQNNLFTYNDQALSSLAGYTSAVLIEPNTVAAAVNVNGWLTGRQSGTTGADASTITVSNNSMVNAGFNPATTYAISQESANETLAATCNWYGATSDPAAKMSGSVTYSPWLVNGTDSDGSTMGFQPVSGTCTGTPVVISSATVDNIWCGETSGAIDVVFSGGTGPYNIAWPGGSATGVTSPYSIAGLALGTYSLTITDANGSTDDESGLQIQYFPVHNSTADTRHATIVAAIDAAAAGDTIEICDGTYTAQNITVNKRLDINGQGDGTIIQNNGGTVFTYTAAASGTGTLDRAYLRNVKVSGSTKGLYVQELVNYLTLDDVTFDGNSSYAIHVNNTSGTMNDWAITNCTFNANSSAVYVSMAANINQVSITGSTFTNQTNSAIYAGQSSGTPGGFSNVTITDNTFTDNGPSNNQAAFYIEKLSDAIISDNTMTNNGLSTNPRGIIVNLKYGTYNDVRIADNMITETRGATQTNGYGVNVQGRNDASSYNTFPGSLDTLAVTGNEIAGFLRGVEIDNDVDWNTTTITNNKVSGSKLGILGVIYGTANTANTGTTMEVHDNSILSDSLAVTNVNPNGGTIDAECNWYGTFNGSTIAGKISGTVDYSPWLINGTDSDTMTIGFQPVSGACSATSVEVTLATQTNITGCFGDATGAIDINVSGGTGAGTYTYLWSNDATTEDISDLIAGAYTVTVTDGIGTTDTLQVTITQPTAVAPSGTPTSVSCFGGANGSIALTTTGGTGAYTYSWSGPNSYTSTDEDPSSLAAGAYTVTVTDANSCTGATTVTVTQPAAALAASISATMNVSCNGGNNGSATVSASGGTSPYTYDWPGTPTTATVTASGLEAGNYEVTVTDANSCTTTASATITEPDALLASITAQSNVSCNGLSDGSATVTASGGTSPYTYEWPGTPAGDGTVTVTGLAAGGYEVTVTDANSCTTTATATITQPGVLSLSTSQSNVSCRDGSNGTATVSPSGGTSPYSYDWNGTPTGDGTVTITGLTATSYTVTVTDDEGCTSSATVTITQPGLLAITASPANATATGACPTSTDIETQFAAWNTAISVSGGVSPQTTTAYSVTDLANNTSTEIYSGATATAPPKDGGFTTVTWTVTDSCGNTATASATFTVNNCMRVSGNILFYRDSSGLSGVSADMVGTGANDDVSLSSGAYSVYSTTSGSFTVTPSKAFAISDPVDTNRVTGIINVHDVQAIQQHVGSGTQFSNIYQRVAANVVLGTAASQTNNRLTSSDATSLSQAINGSSTQRARLRWRFIPSDSSLIVGAPATLPRSWGLVPDTGSVAGNQAPAQYGKFPIKRNYNPLNGPWTGQNFTAVLVGDVVPNPASTIGNNGAEVRYAGTPLVWRVKDAHLKAGETIEAVFKAEQLTDIKGWQFGLHFDPEYLQVEDLTTTTALPLDPEVNFGLYQADQGDIRSLWADAEKQSLKAGEQVFTVRFKALQSGRTLSSVLGLDDEVLESYALSESLDRVAVILAFDGVRPISEMPVLHQNTPNPFDKETRVRFELPSDSDIQLTIHDVNGRVIKEFNGFYTQGLHELRFGRGELGQYTGILYYTLRSGEFTATRKMVVID